MLPRPAGQRGTKSNFLSLIPGGMEAPVAFVGLASRLVRTGGGGRRKGGGEGFLYPVPIQKPASVVLKIPSGTDRTQGKTNSTTTGILLPKSK